MSTLFTRSRSDASSQSYDYQSAVATCLVATWWRRSCIVVSVRLNGSRLVTGVLRGFDPFMNLVIDEAVEECKTGEKNHIGMVVCDLSVQFI